MCIGKAAELNQVDLHSSWNSWNTLLLTCKFKILAEPCFTAMYFWHVFQFTSVILVTVELCFTRINDFLSCLNLGERTIKGCLEAYSCKNNLSWKKITIFLWSENECCWLFLWYLAVLIGKHTGSDKKLSFSLENEVKCEFA